VARILLIEDNPDNLELMSYLLGAYGHTVSTAEDGEHGVETARREHPDLIACDIHLPRADGYAVIKQLKSDDSLSGTPVVAVTALAMVGDREKVLAAGFDGYITKPIDPQTFVGEVDNFLRPDLRGALPEHGFADEPAPVAMPRQRHAEVLVVDDSPTNLELIYQTLVPFGYDVRLAESVQAGMEMMMSEPVPDLILSDLHMPGEDGFHFVHRIRSDPRLAKVPFLFISSSVWGESERETALALGVTRFLLRPIEPQALIREIENCLAAGKESRDGDDPRR
jgi:two-component system cell cycle response regulator